MAYLQAVKGLVKFSQQPAERLTNDQIQEYLLHCIQARKLAWNKCNVIFSGLKKFYHCFLGRDNSGFFIPPRPRSHQLPMFLNRDEVRHILNATDNLKHHALLAIIYGSSLRVNEAVRLRAEHIDSKKYRKNHAMTDEQRKVMAAIMACRTARLGGHQEVCDQCGNLRNCYNSCRNRHCPKCQTMTKDGWLTKRREELLPCGYFHMVFTVPHVLNPLILKNKKELYTCLFAAVRDTVFAFAADPQWRLEGKPGILTILHRWSQTLIDHFHIHCLIPAGVLTFGGKRWVPSKEDFLFHVKKCYLDSVKSRLDTLVLPENYLCQGNHSGENAPLDRQ